jgi:hypothetical protein
MTPLVNGQAYAWADINVTLFGQRIAGIDAIAYKEVEAKTNNYGAGQRPVSRSRGQITTEGSITLHMSEVKALEAAAGGSITNIESFDIVVAYLPKNGVAVTETIRNVEFLEDGRDPGKDGEYVAVEIPLIFSHIDFV